MLPADANTWLRAPLLRVRVLALGAALLASAALPPRAAVAEDLAMPAGPLGSALDLVAATPDTSDLAAVLDEHGVSVRFVVMAPGIYARYSVARQSVEIDERWSAADSATLAAVIAHEATHARDAVDGYLTGGGAAACIDSEFRAFRASATLWTATYGPTGKARPADELERQLNLIAEREASDPVGLESLVRQAYGDQCGG